MEKGFLAAKLPIVAATARAGYAAWGIFRG
jgi:hypothetical protein